MNAELILENNVTVEYDGKTATIGGSIDDLLKLLTKSSAWPHVYPSQHIQVRDVSCERPDSGSDDTILRSKEKPAKPAQAPKPDTIPSESKPAKWQVTQLTPEDFLSMDTENPHPSFLTSGGFRTDGLYLLESAPNPKELFTITEFSRRLSVGDNVLRYFVAPKCVKYFWNGSFYMDVVEVDAVLRRHRKGASAKLDEMVKEAPGFDVPGISGFYPYSNPNNPWVMMIDDIACICGIGGDSLRNYLANCMNANCPRMIDIRRVLAYREKDEKRVLGGGQGQIPSGNANLKRCIDEISNYCKRNNLDARVSLSA